MKTNPSQFEQERIRKRYDGMARSYAATGQLIVAHWHEATAALGVQPGERILDVACGPGMNFEGILRNLGTGGSLVGLDYSPGMLEQAQQRVERSGWSNVNPKLGDAASLPFGWTYQSLITASKTLPGCEKVACACSLERQP